MSVTLDDLNNRVTVLEGLLGDQSATDDSAPLWMQNVAYPAQAVRQLTGAIWQQPGVIWGMGVTPRGAGANMSVDVAPGQCVVAGTDTPNQGPYLFTFFSTTNVPVQAAPGAGTTRRDLVVVQASDDAVLGGGLNRPRGQIVSLPGTATATPQLPSVPNSSLVMAELGPFDYQTAQVTAPLIAERAPVASSGGRSMIATRVLNTGDTAADFSSIPQSFNHLEVVATGRTSTGSDISVLCNGDAGTNYYTGQVWSSSTNSMAGGQQASPTNSPAILQFSLSTTNNSSHFVHIANYRMTFPAGVQGRSIAGQGFRMTAAGNQQMTWRHVWWNSAAAINRLTFTCVGGTFNAGTTFQLYGLI